MQAKVLILESFIGPLLSIRNSCEYWDIFREFIHMCEFIIAHNDWEIIGESFTNKGVIGIYAQLTPCVHRNYVQLTLDSLQNIFKWLWGNSIGESIQSAIPAPHHAWPCVIRQAFIKKTLFHPTVAPGNPTLWRGVPVTSIQKSFWSSERNWRSMKKLPIPCNFCTNRFITYSCTRYCMVCMDLLMTNIKNPHFVVFPAVNAAWFVVVQPC